MLFSRAICPFGSEGVDFEMDPGFGVAPARLFFSVISLPPSPFSLQDVIRDGFVARWKGAERKDTSRKGLTYFVSHEIRQFLQCLDPLSIRR